MKPEHIDKAVDHVAELVKLGIRRALEETDRASDTVSETVSSAVSKFRSATGQKPAADDQAEIWMPMLGKQRRMDSGDVYTIVAFSRMVGTEPLLRVRFSDDSTGEYPLSNAMDDAAV